LISLPCSFVHLQDGQTPRFSHIAAMHSELVAVNLAGQLCQWRWSDPEPYSSEVSFVMTLLVLRHFRLKVWLVTISFILIVNFWKIND